MNWKALKETLTPKVEILGYILLPIVLAIIAGIVLAMGAAINIVLILVFGEAMAELIVTIIAVCWFSWLLVIGPLVDRYKRISQGLK